jgi:Family of unknown function (DUF6516)
MAKPLRITPMELATFAFSRGFSARGVDLVVSIIAPNIRSSIPFIGIKLVSPAYLLFMLPDADKCFVYGEGGRFHFSAYYRFFDRCPFARIYSYALEDIFEIAELDRRLRQYGYKMPTIAQRQFEAVIDIQGHAARVDTYSQNLEKERRTFVTLFEGRREAQITSNGVWFNSTSCMTCGGKGEVMATSSFNGFPFIAGEEGMIVGFCLCTKCADEASTRSSFHAFIAEKFNFHDPLYCQRYWKRLSQEDVFEIGKYTLECDLKKCTLQKVDHAQSQLTGIRESGIKVIFRLEGISKYAYMIFDSKGKQLGRFDSSDHHPELPFQPDHFHYALPNSRKVRSSFLTGIPTVDAAAIRAYIEGIERQS